MKPAHQKLAASALIFVNLLYGASHVLAKGVMPTFLSPNVFILFRVVGATLLFWILRFVWPLDKIEKKDAWTFFLCSFFGVAVNQLFFFHGLNLSSPINAGIIMALNPIMVALICVGFLKQSLSLIQWIGMGVGALGAMALTLTNGDAISTHLGDVFLVVNSLSYAIYLVLAKPLMSKYSPLTVITWVFTLGTILVALYPGTWFDLKTISFDFPLVIWYKIIYVIVGVTFLTYLLTVVGLKYASSTVTSVFIYLQPVFVIGFTYLFSALGWSDDYSDSISVSKIFWMLVIFAGVAMTSNFKLKKNA